MDGSGHPSLGYKVDDYRHRCRAKTPTDLGYTRGWRLNFLSAEMKLA
jgi:hypothetical protein